MEIVTTLHVTDTEDGSRATRGSDSYDMFTDTEGQSSSPESQRVSVFVANLPMDLNTQPRRPSPHPQHHRAISDIGGHGVSHSSESHRKHRKSNSAASITPKPSAMNSVAISDIIATSPRTRTNVEDQERLFTLQSNLKHYIGDDVTLILSQFLDLMDNIAPHIPAHEAINMFNQMDAANDGQIPTSLLLHNGFLPRLILVRSDLISFRFSSLCF